MIVKNSEVNVLIILLSLIIFFANSSETLLRYYTLFPKQIIPANEPGYEFADLKPLLKNIEKVGYFTNRNVSPEDMDVKYFLQAQYMLAPITLELNTYQEYLIVDCSNLIEAFTMTAELKARPIYVNPFGIILAQRK